MIKVHQVYTVSFENTEGVERFVTPKIHAMAWLIDGTEREESNCYILINKKSVLIIRILNA